MTDSFPRVKVAVVQAAPGLFDREGTPFAKLDLAEVAQGKYDFDVVGHYARPDVLQLTVNERPQPPVANEPGQRIVE